MGVGWGTAEGNDQLIVLGFNDMSTQRKGEEIEETVEEKGRRDRRDSRGDEREGQGRKRKTRQCSSLEKADWRRKQSLNSKDYMQNSNIAVNDRV